MKFYTGQAINQRLHMGFWGIGLYQNDIALDVKDQFKEMLQSGKTVSEVTNALTESFNGIFDDFKEGLYFWLALADTQWNHGILLSSVKEHVFHLLDQQEVQCLYQLQGTATDEEWRKCLDGLRTKLASAVPSTKKTKQRRTYRCQWKMGDVFAYQLESELAIEKGVCGRYLLIQKVDEGNWHPGHIVPIVYVKITDDDNLPSNKEEYDLLPYVQVSFSRYEERFFPLDMHRVEEDIAEKSKLHYEVDEYGLLPQYRVKLLQLSQKDIPSKLIYLGNFANTDPPKKEFIPHGNVNMWYVSWKKFAITFEDEIIKRYFGHNRREFQLYQKKHGDYD